ncbi:MAG: hypothetical protein WA888_13510 [Burkholderiaceae bacterium]
MIDPLNQSLWISAVLFIVSAVGIWIAGSKLVDYADTIADRKQLGKAFMGLVLLATVTSLPEIATTVTASVSGNAQLAMNNLFGGITMQTATLAVVDAFIVRGALTHYPRTSTHALEAALLILLLSMLLGIGIGGEIALVYQIGLGSLVLSVAYALCIILLRKYEAHGDWVPVELPDKKAPAPRLRAVITSVSLPMKALVIRSAIASLIILVCGVVLARSAEAIAIHTSLGSNFVGVTILAASTSLPELSTTIAAARMGSFNMAISNIFGSNLIMVALLLPADVLYRGGPILSEVSAHESFALVCGILVTAIYVVGILVRKKPRVLQMGIDSIGVLIVYIGSLFALYYLR